MASEDRVRRNLTNCMHAADNKAPEQEIVDSCVVQSEDGHSALPDCGDSIDPMTFEQILEMDDDDERDFSRSIVFGFFEQAESTFVDMDKSV